MNSRQLEKKIQEMLFLPEYSFWKNKVFSVGGAVRDEVLNLNSIDVDILVLERNGAEMFANGLKNFFGSIVTKPHQLGLHYPIFKMTFLSGEFQGMDLDVAESQKEMFPKAEQRQRIASFGTFEEDMQRRDFTINMLARNLTTDDIIDESGCGLADIKARIIRAHPKVDADKVLFDDPLRMLRAIRFACTHQMQIDSKLSARIFLHADRLKIVSPERVVSEFEKVIKYDCFDRAIALLSENNLLKNIFSEKLQALILQRKADSRPFNSSGISNDLASKISFLFLDLSPSEAFKILSGLNLSKASLSKAQALRNLGQQLATLDVTDFISVRKFLRTCDLDIKDIIGFAHFFNDQFLESQFYSTKMKCEIIPIEKRAILNGDEISKILQIKGGQIKTAIDLLFKIEDDFIAKYSKAIDKNQAQEALILNFFRPKKNDDGQTSQ